jgi:hypothetical protein
VAWQGKLNLRKEKIMQQTFDEKILAGAEKSVDKYLLWIDGDVEGSPTIRGAEKMITWAIKVKHMLQIAKFTERSHALRLLKFLPNDKARERYIKLTNPELKPILLERPKK